jgi:hypothetical protein
MSKTQTLTVAIVSTIIVVTTGIIGIPWLPWMALCVALVSLLWYGYKWFTHACLRKEAEDALIHEEPAEASICSPDSYGLFVPDSY